VEHIAPDGRVLLIEKSLMAQCCEVFFKPSLIGLEDASLSLPLQILSSVQMATTSKTIQNELLSNIVLAGGGAGTVALGERLSNELMKLYNLSRDKESHDSPPIRVVFPSTETERKQAANLAWIGGARMAKDSKTCEFYQLNN